MHPTCCYCVQLRCLYLGRNLIHRIRGLDRLVFLETLDLSENDIHTVEGLRCLQRLTTMNLSGNKLHSAADLEELRHCSTLRCLDVSSNCIDDSSALALLAALPLSLLRASGNPVASTTRSAGEGANAAGCG